MISGDGLIVRLRPRLARLTRAQILGVRSRTIALIRDVVHYS